MTLMLPDGHSLDPERTGIVVFDALEKARKDFEESGALDTIRQLLVTCRETGVPVFYARADHRADGQDFEGCHGDTDSGFQTWDSSHPSPTRPKTGSGSFPLQVLSELAPRPELRYSQALVECLPRYLSGAVASVTRYRHAASCGRLDSCWDCSNSLCPVSYTHLRAHETKANLVCRLLLEKKKRTIEQKTP